MAWSKKQLSTLLVVVVTSFMGTFLVSSINISLPAIEKSFELNAVALSWVVTAFILASAMILLPAGKWGDVSGNARLFKIGLIIFTIASVFCAVAPNATWLIVARFVQGIGSAFSNTTGQAILVSIFPLKQRGQVIGFNVASVYTGLALGPLIGGFFTQHIGWPSIFWIAALLGILATIIAFMFLEKERLNKAGAKNIDYRGTVFYMIGLPALVYGSSVIPSPTGWTLIVTGILLLIIFWLSESRAANPMFDTKLFTHNRLFAFSNIASLINYTATFAIVFFLSLYLQKIKGLAPQDAGMIIIAQPLMMAIFSPIVGKWSDKIQPRYFATLGMTMCTMGLAAFAFLNENTPLWLIFSILVWVGLGFGLFSSPNTNTIMSSVGKTQYGQASGTAASMRMIGQIFSMSIATLFFAILFGGEAVSEVSVPTFLSAVRWGFTTFAFIGLVGIYFSTARGDLNRGSETER